jgi:hypothetical protein
MDNKTLKHEVTMEMATLDADIEELERKVAPGLTRNHNETLIGSGERILT